MYQFKMFVLYLFPALIAMASAAENCDHLGMLFYEDIGCKSVTKDGSKCPIKYECPDFELTKETCLFKGRSLAKGEKVDNDMTYPACQVGCSCNGVGEFTCAILDCPEWLGVPVGFRCYRKYESNKCCSVGQNCPSDNSTFGECRVEGKKILEGERFYPKGTCLSCVCPASFNGEFKEPYCNRQLCAIQIRDSDKLQQKCAPFYTKHGDENAESLCCPDEWVCPLPTDEIVRINSKADNTDLTCQFGTKTVKLGDGLKSRKVDYYSSKKTAECECILPPFLTCKET